MLAMADPHYGWLGDAPLRWQTFLDTPPHEADPADAVVFIIPVPYDSTTSFRGGARLAPDAIIAASHHLEDYDIELDRDISEIGIHTTPALQPDVSSPKMMIRSVRSAITAAAGQGKLIAMLGGEHTITIGAVQAFADLYPDLSVLYLDAHADMRHCYMGTHWGHASVARRIHDICPVMQIGVRSISSEEMQFVRDNAVPMYFWQASNNLDEIAALALANLSDNVYISIDLDVFDPSVMSAVGTPEPHGMLWGEATELLRKICVQRNIVGFDLTELSPEEGPVACAYTAAKLAYKLIGYSTNPLRL